VRILLINPPSPERLGAPLLGFQYVAAALLRAGHEVRVIDAAARHFRHDAEWIAAQVQHPNDLIPYLQRDRQGGIARDVPDHTLT